MLCSHLVKLGHAQLGIKHCRRPQLLLYLLGALEQRRHEIQLEAEHSALVDILFGVKHAVEARKCSAEGGFEDVSRYQMPYGIGLI